MLFTFNLKRFFSWTTWQRLWNSAYTKFCAWSRYFLRQHEPPPLSSSFSPPPPPPAIPADLESLDFLSFPGSTALFFRAGPGVLLKASCKIGSDRILRMRDLGDPEFTVEKGILGWLGEHPRIVRFVIPSLEISLAVFTGSVSDC